MYVHGERLSEEQLNKLVELWRLQDCLLFRLRVSKFDYDNTDFERKVAHYCRADALPGILKDGLKLCSLSSANDTTEGKRFAFFVGRAIDPMFDEKGEKGKKFVEYADNHAEDRLVLQCSFSTRIDDLNQFRLYGRDSVVGGEGTGLCLVLNMTYFANQYADAIPTDRSVYCRQIERANENFDNVLQRGVESDDDGSRLPLYWVLYYDTNRDVFYYTPCLREMPFCINPGDKRNKRAAVIYKEARDNQQGLQKLMERVRNVFADLEKLEVRDLGWDLCIYLRHLIKDAAFRDEREMRVMELCSLDNADAQILHRNGSLSIPYCRLVEKDKFSDLEKVIAGPRVKNMSRLRELMRHTIRSEAILRTYGPKDKDVVQSDVPLA